MAALHILPREETSRVQWRHFYSTHSQKALRDVLHRHKTSHDAERCTHLSSHVVCCCTREVGARRNATVHTVVEMCYRPCRTKNGCTHTVGRDLQQGAPVRETSDISTGSTRIRARTHKRYNTTTTYMISLHLPFGSCRSGFRALDGDIDLDCSVFRTGWSASSPLLLYSQLNLLS